ncbi:unnamed protein product [Zymoseptoria tritici ST99CH_1E4]|uniref:Rgp1-domain-containing protein n=1 Tax=Zymoseptoria tritici ST99CH_1E4 TaxID=1276532 RepID=A0A2H1FNC9_ZYMTR|nr:unnamed protein product [Zymoseptoria tritici ST99CH_1E4]
MHSGQNRSYSPPWAGGVPQSAMNPLTRVMSANSQDGTPRTSSEFYSMSNHSDETLFSEIATPQNYHGQQQQGRLLPKNTATHSQQLSRSLSTRKTFSSEPQTLMMAYVQTMGHFTLDGSLVNTAPFEEVKRKGVQGGGGVVGVERSKRSSGLFGALSWGNIGESLGGLLGGDEMSSMAQMKASVGSKTIPLLSTPQSLLFVDLRLAPGESKSFSYRFVLPRGLPPTHKGRAMKVSYFLSLGVQRPEGQQVKTLEIPFRMLGSYDSRGDTLGHDLMSPYVLLQDAARTHVLSPDAVTPNGRPTPEAQRKLKAAATKKSRSPQQGLEDFLRYTERLLDTPSDIHGALLSPTSPSSNSGIPSSFPLLSRQNSSADATPSTIREAIDLAILRSNFATTTSSPSPSSSPSSPSERQPTTPAAAANRFNISRNTHPVAVLTLLRPAYRLGESVLGTLDFTALPSAQVCYAVNLTLESSEIIDSSLALRSSSSVLRATRKIHAAQSVNTLFSRRVAFSLAVPADVAPGFETSGVGVRWRVRVEFVVGREKVRVEEEEKGGGDDEEDGEDHGLWETVGKDERGVVRIARERLGAEEFGIEVPIRVLGAVGVEAGNGEGGGFVG